MITLIDYLLGRKVNETEADSRALEIMNWLRAAHNKCPHSFEDVNRIIRKSDLYVEQPFDARSFFNCDNPLFYHVLLAIDTLRLNIADMHRIILGIPDFLPRLPEHLRDQYNSSPDRDNISKFMRDSENNQGGDPSLN